ncbi:MAG: NarK/NasA family nitrate transporter [Planctomycetes bacterium]|nr:NarK/NasA family nitrate transporter [Planctomycetota bacterium]
MSEPVAPSSAQAWRVLSLSTSAFTLLFAAWLVFGIIAPPIRREFALDEVQVSWLGALAVLVGSVLRLPLGMATDRLGGRRVFIALLVLAAIACGLLATASSYGALLACAALVGLAGNSFSAGIAWNAAWFDRARQGFALGTFGAGNVGASVTKLAGPLLIALIPVGGLAGGLIPGGWRAVPAMLCIALLLMALAVWRLAPADRTPGKGRALGAMLAPLACLRVWRFGLYYVLVFGAYVALSLVLPSFYVETYSLSLAQAGMLTALFIFPASLLRPLGGWMSDRWGARPVTYGVFALMLLATLPLAAPALGLGAQPGVGAFTALMIALGVGMGVGKASVFKYIADYFPADVGAVGGLVGTLGALGGFALPLAFGYLKRGTGEPAMMFLVLAALTVVTLAWLHVVVVGMRRAKPSGVALSPALDG